MRLFAVGGGRRRQKIRPVRPGEEEGDFRVDFRPVGARGADREGRPPLLALGPPGRHHDHLLQGRAQILAAPPAAHPAHGHRLAHHKVEM